MSQTPNLKSSREVIPKRKHVLQLGIVFSSKWAQVLSHHTVLFFGFERDSKANLEFGLFQISTCVDSNPRDLEQFLVHTHIYSTNQNSARSLFLQRPGSWRRFQHETRKQFSTSTGMNSLVARTDLGNIASRPSQANHKIVGWSSSTTGPSASGGPPRERHCCATPRGPSGRPGQDPRP
ncbi:Hypothetical_protein [Hexamita inflata]|uniref:Hypothetical_protein n=1 Tax=Hexamita inflata TaxID=28002 RepID=A0AA86TGN5_9EUKA|nr:Hypothetical protein HINF_LOCUS4665 [Hexamita inflata]